MTASLGGMPRLGFASWVAGLAPGAQDVPADMAEEQPFEGIAQLSDGRGERQPFDGHDVFHHIPARVGFGLHAPELYDLRPPARPIRDGAYEFAHANTVSGFLDHFPAGAGERVLVPLELAARQHPEFVLRALHDGDERARAVAHHNAACRLNSLARHSRSTCSK